MTISFRNNAGDIWHQYVFLAAKTITGRLCLAIMLGLPAIGPALMFFSTPPGAQADHFSPVVLLIVLGVMYAVLALCVLIAFSLAAWMMPEFTITLEPDHFGMIYLRSSKIPWPTFLRLVNQPKFFGFLGWQRLIFIPRHAFASPDEAERFYQTALTYWQAAKGTALPATHTTDLQEPGAMGKH